MGNENATKTVLGCDSSLPSQKARPRAAETEGGMEGDLGGRQKSGCGMVTRDSEEVAERQGGLPREGLRTESRVETMEGGAMEETGGARVDKTEGGAGRDLEQEERGVTQAAAMIATHGGADRGRSHGGGRADDSGGQQMAAEPEAESRQTRVTLRIWMAKVEPGIWKDAVRSQRGDRRDLKQEEPGLTTAAAMMATHGGADRGRSHGGGRADDSRGLADSGGTRDVELTSQGDAEYPEGQGRAGDLEGHEDWSPEVADGQRLNKVEPEGQGNLTELVDWSGVDEGEEEARSHGGAAESETRDLPAMTPKETGRPTAIPPHLCMWWAQADAPRSGVMAE
ncbi:Ion-translocating oxidoreductase complex subunit B [Labeo rohita]|uniref:Ion-translocating oxidoreductase complex subunit B n=1 Tax=Labeo rohita TaxID=84645 RepID=A0ABQ8LWN2_LABRO|nr:Ion-translocating oxidoreductase complex subunit B [Labeo rohita]